MLAQAPACVEQRGWKAVWRCSVEIPFQGPWGPSNQEAGALPGGGAGRICVFNGGGGAPKPSWSQLRQ